MDQSQGSSKESRGFRSDVFNFSRRHLFAQVAGLLTLLLTLPLPLRRKKDLGSVPDREGFWFRSGFWIVREKDRLAVTEGFCPHWGCRIHAGPQGFRCPCHGSRFSRDGEKLEGPSPRSLFWYPPLLLRSRIFIVLKRHSRPVWCELPSLG